MKLLCCLDCSDIFNLRTGVVKGCRCGKVGGMYLPDRDNVAYWGSPMFLALSNPELEAAIRQELEDERDGIIKAQGYSVRSWCFPWHYRKFKRYRREQIEEAAL
jgi:hypothetical protein